MAVNTLKILVIHGPNLNLLGTREPEIYGNLKLEDINSHLQESARAQEAELEIFQSNHEGEIVDAIQKNSDAHGILINPAALTHSSVAIRDALLAVGKPVVEVHLSNIFAREEFRKTSLISDIAVGVVTGFGANSYAMGLNALIADIKAFLGK